MKQNYFELNGEKYYTGTIFVIKDYFSNSKEIEATFICYDTDWDKYFYRFNGKSYSLGSKRFWENFVSPTGKFDSKERGVTVVRKKEFDIPGMALGWTWYVFLMLLSAIFKDALGLWLLISFVFFNWRSKKIANEGTHYKW